MKKAESYRGVIMGDCCNKDFGCGGGGIFGGGDNIWWIIIIVVLVLCFCPGIFGGGGRFDNKCCDHDPCC
jgi:hypothetical protein